MAKLREEEVIEKFDDFGVTLTQGSPLFEKCKLKFAFLRCALFRILCLLLVLEIGHSHGFDAEKLCNEWVAFGTSRSCVMDLYSLGLLQLHLQKSSRRAPTSRKTVSKSRGHTSPGTVGGMVMSQENLDDL